MTVGWRSSTVRNVVAFWIFGLCNNYGYVIMLSAAEDIMSKQEGTEKESDNSTCLADISHRKCERASTGAVLLADILPVLIVKATMPFFMQRIPYGFRHAIVVGLQAASYFVVAYSQSYAVSLMGVVLAAAGSGLGEITYLSLTSHFTPVAVSSWSSGTGGAGVIGSFAYAALTEPHMANLSPKDAVLVMLVVPVLFAIAYWIILDCPPSVYTPTAHPKTWIVPKNEKSRMAVVEATDGSGSVQRSTTFMEKLQIARPLLKFMIPFSLVYFGEYLINQGLTQLIYFDCDHGFRLAKSSQYRWFQVLYQVGVFISRSSVSLIELPLPVLYLLPVLQIGNAVFFFFEAKFFFVPHIAIIFALILVEGLLGGSSYVNTFNYLHRHVKPDVKEFSLSFTSLGDSIGIVFAAFVAILIHDWICDSL